MKSIAFYNNKGGVGKTTSAINIAYELAKNSKVLIIDVDGQTRVSCWCCPLQSLDELRQLYKHFPDLWEKLKDWDNRTWRNFRADFSVEQLETRFDLEKKYLANGLSIRNRAFFNELHKLID